MDLQYGRRQYSVKQYGKYKSKDTDKPKHSKKILMGKSRIMSVTKNKETSGWTTQVTPVIIEKKSNKLKLKSNIGEIIHSQTINIEGNLNKVRISTKGETVMSESL